MYGQPRKEYKARKHKTYLRHGLGLPKSGVLASLTTLVMAVFIALKTYTGWENEG